MIFKMAVIVLIVLSGCAADSYKVALHVHSSQYNDDGHQTLLEVASAYKSHGYDAIIYTPHGNIPPFNCPINLSGIYIIPGYEEETPEGWHILHFGELTCLAHPMYTIFQKGISARPYTDFTETYNALAGFATDNTISLVGEDSHDIHHPRFATTSITVNASNLKNILDSIRNGNFQIKVEGNI